ncbi:MAG: thylakoid-associated protein [Leptolyngbyaceae cyanobacterium bins.349]|nr:thylakoid-associated protein [Leptolyngbyaceae cyanobacterium bins.349]
MDATRVVADSQAQWNESQKKMTELWNESQKQLIESQKKLVDAWIGNVPSGISMGDMTGNYEKALNFQRELVNSTLQAQQVSFYLAVESQKQFWDNYFQSTHRMFQQTTPQ